MSQGRGGRIRRARLVGAVAMALPASAAAVVGFGIEGGLPWWVVMAGTLAAAGFGGWAGAQIGRQRGIRNEVLEPGETVLGTYTVRPPYTRHTPPSAHEGPQYQLRMTTRHLEMWERAVLLWRHPLTELRLLTEGPRLRIHHDGREAGTMLLEHPNAAHDICSVARRHGAT